MEKNRMDTTKIQKLIDSEIVFPYEGIIPEIDDTVFLASGSKIIGDVKICKYASVWYNTVIRGDVNYIRIGEMSNIQDCSMLHVTNKLFPLNIGNKVTVGHSVTLHGCTVQDLTLIGMGAIVLDGAVVESNSMVAAGTVVRPGFVVPSGKLVGGVPGKVIRDLTDKEIAEFEESALRYKKYMEITMDSIKQYQK